MPPAAPCLPATVNLKTLANAILQPFPPLLPAPIKRFHNRQEIQTSVPGLSELTVCVSGGVIRPLHAVLAALYDESLQMGAPLVHLLDGEISTVYLCAGF